MIVLIIFLILLIASRLIIRFQFKLSDSNKEPKTFIGKSLLKIHPITCLFIMGISSYAVAILAFIIVWRYCH